MQESYAKEKLREGLEFYLLWQYRLEFGSSTRCNHGRFHPYYIKSTDRKKGLQGYRLPDDAQPNTAGGPSLPPLQLIDSPFDNNWMGLQWNPYNSLEIANVRKITMSPGVYKIFDLEAHELLYVGESKNLRNRLITHINRPWGCSKPLFSYVQLPNGTPAYQRHEIENDLIGGFYALANQTPKFQLTGHH